MPLPTSLVAAHSAFPPPIVGHWVPLNLHSRHRSPGNVKSSSITHMADHHSERLSCILYTRRWPPLGLCCLRPLPTSLVTTTTVNSAFPPRIAGDHQVFTHYLHRWSPWPPFILHSLHPSMATVTSSPITHIAGHHGRRKFCIPSTYRWPPLILHSFHPSLATVNCALPYPIAGHR